MFRWLLRQLHIRLKTSTTLTLEYKCQKCLRYTYAVVTEQEWNDILSGIPFIIAMSKQRQLELNHFKQSICKDCLQQQLEDQDQERKGLNNE